MAITDQVHPVQPANDPASSPAAETFVMPEEFAGKSAEDIAKAYVAAKTEHAKYSTETGEKLKRLDAYGQYGDPEAIGELVAWGKNWAPLFQQIAEGKAKVVTEADGSKSVVNARTGADMGELPAGLDQMPLSDAYKAIVAHIRNQVDNSINARITDESAKFAQGIKGYQDALNRQLQLFSHVIKLQHKHPDLDVDEVMKEAAQLVNMPAEQLFDQLISARVEKANMSKEVEKKVADALARTKQDDQNRILKILTGSKHVPSNGTGREGAYRRILDSLAKQGVLDKLPLQ